MSQNVDEVIKHCGDLITLPEVYHQVSNKLQLPYTTNSELAALIQLEPNIATRLLRIVNSSFYGFPNSISTTAHAISLIGRSDFGNLVLSNSVVELFKQLQRIPLDMYVFWRHSLLAAVCAKRLSRLIGKDGDSGSLFTAGLLHDIGKPLIAQVNGVEAAALIKGWNQGENDIDLERQILGYDHAELGAALLEKWQLPEVLVCAARSHHQIATVDDIPLCVFPVTLANALANWEEARLCELISHPHALAQSLSIDQLILMRRDAELEVQELINFYL